MSQYANEPWLTHSLWKDRCEKEDIAVYEVDEPVRFRLGMASGDSEVIELNVHVQGVICQCELPPVSRWANIHANVKDNTLASMINRSSQRKPAYMERRVTVTGLGTELFANSIANFRVFHAICGRRFNQLKPLLPEKYLQWDSLTVTNRYFTDITGHSYREAVPFDSREDPYGALAKLATKSLIHYRENRMEYFERKLDQRLVPYIGMHRASNSQT